MGYILVPFSPGTPSFITELQAYVDLWKKNIRRTEIWGHICGVRGHKRSKLGRKIKRANVRTPKNYDIFFGLKI